MLDETSPTGVPQLPDALARLLSDPRTLNALIDNSDESEEMIRTLVRDIGNNSEQQRSMLQGIFSLLEQEGGREITFRRDAVVAIMKHPLLRKIILDRSDDCYQAFVQAFDRQTNTNDPYSGSIAALLETGIAAAPYLAWNGAQLKNVKHAIHILADSFPVEERLYIRDEFERMFVLFSPDPALDLRVEEYRNIGQNKERIARREKKSPETIGASIKRLIAQGRTPKWTGLKNPLNQKQYTEREERRKKLKREVTRLRLNDILNKNIAPILGAGKGEVARTINELIAEKKIPKRTPLSKKNSPPEIPNT